MFVYARLNKIDTIAMMDKSTKEINFPVRRVVQVKLNEMLSPISHHQMQSVFQIVGFASWRRLKMLRKWK